PENKVEHPTPDFVDRLLTMRKKGEVMVLPNEPEDTYYVAALITDRVEPSKNAFYQAYQNRPEQLLNRLRVENRSRQEYVQAFLASLKEEAGLRINQETVEKMDEKQRGGQDGG